MNKFPVGMKIYSNDWLLKYRMSPVQIAAFLAEMGINFVITHSQHLPMQDNAVSSAMSAADSARYTIETDMEFRDELRKCGIRYFACMNVGFDPQAARENPEWLPVDQHGRLGDQTDWYVGIPPSNHAFIDHKSRQLCRAVEALQPDGIHLGFARWPGFWETWLPGMPAKDLRGFCYAPASMQQFSEWAGLDIPTNDSVACATMINASYRALFTDWKCAVTGQMIGQLKTAARGIMPQIPVAINTVPFDISELNGAVEQVLGQRHSTLADTVDFFEVMAYHQILRRSINWPAQISARIKQRTGQTTYCTLQTGVHYLSGMHKNAGRAGRITAADFAKMVETVLSADLDGLCFFSLSDFLGGPDSAAFADIVRAI